jgi:uncharacterized membrane protein
MRRCSRVGAGDVGVDAVRGLAILSMYVAHTAPWDAPQLVHELSNLLTAALFATLVGVGAGLSRARQAAWWWPPLVRGAALVALGLALTRVDSLVIVILLHLGLLTWTTAVLGRLPLWTAGVVGAAGFVASPWLRSSLADTDATLSSTGPAWQATLLDLAATGDSYRLTALVAWAAVGLLLARTVLQDPRGTLRLLALGSVALAGATVVLSGLDAALVGHPVVPYSGSHLELVVNALLAVGVLLVATGATRLVRGRGVGWLAGLGRMTLTLYCLHVVTLGLAERALGRSPLGWPVTLALAAGSVALVLAWEALPTRRWGRGPIEGAVERVARPALLEHRSGDPFEARATQ